MRMRRLRWVWGLALAVGLSACTKKPTVPERVDPALVALATAAERIHAELGQLVQVEAADEEVQKRIKHVSVPSHGVMAKPITMKWSGPLVPAVRTIANLVGYQLRVFGAEPIHPPIVQIDVVNRPAFEVLADMGWQAGGRIGVVVSDEAREIQVLYVGTNS